MSSPAPWRNSRGGDWPERTTRALATIEQMGIARETTGRRRNRVFSYERYLRVLSEGTESLQLRESCV